MDKYEANIFRGLVAWIYFLSQNCRERQYPAKELNREVSTPKMGSSKRLKKVARFLVMRRRIVWIFEWHAEVDLAET